MFKNLSGIVEPYVECYQQSTMVVQIDVCVFCNMVVEPEHWACEMKQIQSDGKVSLPKTIYLVRIPSLHPPFSMPLDKCGQSPWLFWVLSEKRRHLQNSSHKKPHFSVLRIRARKPEASFLSGTPAARTLVLDLCWWCVLSWGLSNISSCLVINTCLFLACYSEHDLKISKRKKS